MADKNINFDTLVSQIEQTNEALQNNARLVINRHVTAKAWLTGYYIVEYELKGEDRARYGEQLLQKLAERLNKKNFSYRSLKLYKQFYLIYKPLNTQVYSFLMSLSQIRQTPSAQFLLPDSKELTIGQSVSAQLPIIHNEEITIHTKPELLFNKLSFSHLSAILPCKDPLKRAFYETMAIRGTWSVRELQRQIDSNYYERSGWSQKPEQLASLVDNKGRPSPDPSRKGRGVECQTKERK